MVIQKKDNNKKKKQSTNSESMIWLSKLSIIQWFKLCTLLIFGLVFGTIFTHFVLPYSLTPKSTIVNVPNGASPTMIGHILASKDIIRSSGFFTLYVKLSGVDKGLKSGTYVMSPHFSMTKIIRVLQHLESSRLLERITIPEGYSLKKIYKLMDTKELVNGNEFKTFVEDSKDVLSKKYAFLELNPISDILSVRKCQAFSAFQPSLLRPALSSTLLPLLL